MTKSNYDISLKFANFAECLYGLATAHKKAADMHCIGCEKGVIMFYWQKNVVAFKRIFID